MTQEQILQAAGTLIGALIVGMLLKRFVSELLNVVSDYPKLKADFEASRATLNGFGGRLSELEHVVIETRNDVKNMCATVERIDKKLERRHTQRRTDEE